MSPAQADFIFPLTLIVRSRASRAIDEALRTPFGQPLRVAALSMLKLRGGQQSWHSQPR